MNTEQRPRILSRKTVTVSPWTSLITREVQFESNAPGETYHSVGSAEYVQIIARTPNDLFPIVRQYRPALEGFTLEIPAGLLEQGEDPAQAAARELMEETGFPTEAIHPLGAYATDPGRLSNSTHSFFVETGQRAVAFSPEPRVEVQLVTLPELFNLIRTGELRAQGHLCTVMLAVLHGFLEIH